MEIVLAILLGVGLILTPVGAKMKNGLLVSVGLGSGLLAGILIFVR